MQTIYPLQTGKKLASESQGRVIISCIFI